MPIYIPIKMSFYSFKSGTISLRSSVEKTVYANIDLSSQAAQRVDGTIDVTGEASSTFVRGSAIILGRSGSKLS